MLTSRSLRSVSSSLTSLLSSAIFLLFTLWSSTALSLVADRDPAEKIRSKVEGFGTTRGQPSWCYGQRTAPQVVFDNFLEQPNLNHVLCYDLPSNLMRAVIFYQFLQV